MLNSICPEGNGRIYLKYHSHQGSHSKLMGEKKLFRQEKVRRNWYHQQNFTANVKGAYIGKNYERRIKDLENQPETVKKMAKGTDISIITLPVNGLNAPTKRHRLAEWI